MATAKDKSNLVTIQATLRGVNIPPPIVSPRGEGLLAYSPATFVLGAKRSQWMSLGYIISTPCRVRGLSYNVETLGLFVAEEVFFPGEELRVCFANIGEFVIEVPRNTPVAMIEPVVWRLGEASFEVVSTIEGQQ